MRVIDFAKSRGINPDTVVRYISRHDREFEGHTSMIGNTLAVDEDGLKLLAIKYPLPTPADLVVDAQAREELIKAQQKLIDTQRRMLQISDDYQDLIRKKAESDAPLKVLQERIQSLEALLAEKDKQIQQAQAEAERHYKSACDWYTYAMQLDQWHNDHSPAAVPKTETAPMPLVDTDDEDYY